MTLNQQDRSFIKSGRPLLHGQAQPMLLILGRMFFAMRQGSIVVGFQVKRYCFLQLVNAPQSVVDYSHCALREVNMIEIDH